MNEGARSFGAEDTPQNLRFCGDPVNQKRKPHKRLFENRRVRRPRRTASNGSEVEILTEFL